MAIIKFFEKKQKKYYIVLKTKDIKLIWDGGYVYLSKSNNDATYLGTVGSIGLEKLLLVLKKENLKEKKLLDIEIIIFFLYSD